MVRKKGKNKKKKADPERRQAFESLPPIIKQRLTDEEVQLFLYAEEWPDTLFDKLKEFITTN